MSNSETKARDIVTRHYPCHTIVSVKDTSKGCDNNVFIVEIQEEELKEKLCVVVRIPKKDTHSMHRPYMQAWVLKLLKEYCPNVSVPQLLVLDTENDEYMIESYIPGRDMSDYELSSDQMSRICVQLGKIMQQLHSSISLKKYGYMSENEGIGQFDSWIQMFEPDHTQNILTCKELNYISDEVEHALHENFDSMRPYLTSFNKPCFVHADLSNNNIRLISRQSSLDNYTEYYISGIIDFADAICGDGMYDLGGYLCHMRGDWNVIQEIEKGYCRQQGSFSTEQKKAIIFYALYFCAWFLSVSDSDTSRRNKYHTTLSHLLNLNV